MQTRIRTHLPRRRGSKRFAPNAADAQAAEGASAGEDSWSMVVCLWLLNPAVVFGQLSGKVRAHGARAPAWATPPSQQRGRPCSFPALAAT
jgi:hypothetical protein